MDTKADAARPRAADATGTGPGDAKSAAVKFAAAADTVFPTAVTEGGAAEPSARGPGEAAAQGAGVGAVLLALARNDMRVWRGKGGLADSFADALKNAAEALAIPENAVGEMASRPAVFDWLMRETLAKCQDLLNVNAAGIADALEAAKTNRAVDWLGMGWQAVNDFVTAKKNGEKFASGKNAKDLAKDVDAALKDYDERVKNNSFGKVVDDWVDKALGGFDELDDFGGDENEPPASVEGGRAAPAGKAPVFIKGPMQNVSAARPMRMKGLVNIDNAVSGDHWLVIRRDESANPPRTFVTIETGPGDDAQKRTIVGYVQIQTEGDADELSRAIKVAYANARVLLRREGAPEAPKKTQTPKDTQAAVLADSDNLGTYTAARLEQRQGSKIKGLTAELQSRIARGVWNRAPGDPAFIVYSQYRDARQWRAESEAVRQAAETVKMAFLSAFGQATPDGMSGVEVAKIGEGQDGRGAVLRVRVHFHTWEDMPEDREAALAIACGGAVLDAAAQGHPGKVKKAHVATLFVVVGTHIAPRATEQICRAVAEAMLEQEAEIQTELQHEIERLVKAAGDAAEAEAKAEGKSGDEVKAAREATENGKRPEAAGEARAGILAKYTEEAGTYTAQIRERKLAAAGRAFAGYALKAGRDLFPGRGSAAAEAEEESRLFDGLLMMAGIMKVDLRTGTLNTVFHEYFHLMHGFYTEIGALTADMQAKLTETFHKTYIDEKGERADVLDKNGNKVFNEDAAADAYARHIISQIGRGKGFGNLIASGWDGEKFSGNASRELRATFAHLRRFSEKLLRAGAYEKTEDGEVRLRADVRKHPVFLGLLFYGEADLASGALAELNRREKAVDDDVAAFGAVARNSPKFGKVVPVEGDAGASTERAFAELLLSDKGQGIPAFDWACGQFPARTRDEIWGI